MNIWCIGKSKLDEHLVRGHVKVFAKDNVKYPVIKRSTSRPARVVKVKLYDISYPFVVFNSISCLLKMLNLTYNVRYLQYTNNKTRVKDARYDVVHV